MKMGLFVLLAMFALCAVADVRIEIGPNGYNNKGDNFAHAPYDPDETDNEMYYVPSTLYSLQSDAGYTQSAEARGQYWFADERMLPPQLQGDCKGNNGKGNGQWNAVKKLRLVLTSDEVDEACTIEANNTTYTSNDWRVVFVRLCKQNKLNIRTFCYDGAAVED